VGRLNWLSPTTLNQEQRHDLLEILEDRHDLKATLVTSQLPAKHWHEQIGDPTLADAILERLVYTAHKIDSTQKVITICNHMNNI